MSFLAWILWDNAHRKGKCGLIRTYCNQKAICLYNDRILPPCNYCHHPWCVGRKSYHKALLIMFGCDGISDHASWNELFHYRDTKLSWADLFNQNNFHVLVPSLLSKLSKKGFQTSRLTCAQWLVAYILPMTGDLNQTMTWNFKK